jgi:hypothetical protein
MTADTASYIALQKIYQAKAAADVQQVAAKVAALAPEGKRRARSHCRFVLSLTHFILGFTKIFGTFYF